MNLPARVVLFASSYAPLGGLYFLLYVGTNNQIALASLGIAVLSTIALWLLLRWWKRDGDPTCDAVLEYQKPGAEVMGYIASYLLPFLGFSLDSRRHIAVLGAYLVILGYLYVTTDMIRVNPTLSLLGYGVYDAKLQEYGATWLLARGRIRRGSLIPVVAVGGNLMVQKASECSNTTSK
jgi:hypothetical protein